MRVLPVLCLLCPLALSTAAADELSDVIERSEKSVVRIEVKSDGGDSLGSGFVVGPGIIATNVHVLAGAKTAKAIFPDQRSFEINSTLFYDPSRDIAIANLSGDGAASLPVLNFSTAAPRKGERVVALGSPLGLSFTATSGVISAIRPALELSRELGRKELQGTWIQVDAALSPGNSGGPIINYSGEIVAMSTLASQGAQNLNFGISASDIKSAVTSASSATPILLHAGVGQLKHGEQQSSESEQPEIPKAAIDSYVALGRTEFRSIKRDLTKEIERLRSDMKEMRAGQTFIPPALNKEDSNIVRVVTPGKKTSRTWFFRGESLKRQSLDLVEDRLRDLAKIAQQAADPKDNEALLTLLWKYGPKIDTRSSGSVGFLSGAIVLHAANDHDVLVIYEDAPYVLYLESTAGLSPGVEVAPTPVFVSGTATAKMRSGSTASVTTLKAVTYDELKNVVMATGDKSDAAGVASATPPAADGVPGTGTPSTGSPSTGTTGAGAPLSAESGMRMWHDRSGKFAIQAILLQSTPTEVVLRRADGKTIRVPRSSLSEADQRYLKN